MENVALGMIETYGYIGAIEAADVCLKAANVTLIGCEFVKGGFVAIHIRGDVGAVKASIDAALVAVKKIGHLQSAHVIPRPSGDVDKLLPKLQVEKNKQSLKNSEALNELKTVDLRALARKIDDQLEGALSIERSQIKYAKKDELIEAILAFYKGVQ